MKKQLISGIASIAIIMNTMSIDFTVNAKVIEPEIVKTETWTTSYFIDDDMETLYPYIDCQADIYNDGTVKVYFWNTHEWNGFDNFKHKVTIVDTIPVSYSKKENILNNGFPIVREYNPNTGERCYSFSNGIYQIQPELPAESITLGKSYFPGIIPSMDFSTIKDDSVNYSYISYYPDTYNLSFEIKSFSSGITDNFVNDRTYANQFVYNLIPQNSKRFSDSEESTNPAVTVAERES